MRDRKMNRQITGDLTMTFDYPCYFYARFPMERTRRDATRRARASKPGEPSRVRGLKLISRRARRLISHSGRARGRASGRVSSERQAFRANSPPNWIPGFHKPTERRGTLSGRFPSAPLAPARADERRPD